MKHKSAPPSKLAMDTVKSWEMQCPYCYMSDEDEPNTDCDDCRRNNEFHAQALDAFAARVIADLNKEETLK